MNKDRNEKRKEENRKDMHDFFDHFFSNQFNQSPKDIFEIFEERVRRMQEEMNRYNQISERTDQCDESDDKPRIYGWSYYQGPDGIPHYQEYSNTNNIPSNETPELTTQKNEPFIDVIDAEKEIYVTVEIPGINKENIDVILNKETLNIEIRHPERGFSKVVDLPSEVVKRPVEAKYNNGVLSITLKKKKSKKKGNRIDIQ